MSNNILLGFTEMITMGTIISFGTMLGGDLGHSLMLDASISLANEIVKKGAVHLKEKWLNNRKGVLNHDIQHAFGRSCKEAFKLLKEEYVEINSKLEGSEKENNSSIEAFFDMLSDNVDNNFINNTNLNLNQEYFKKLLKADNNFSSNRIWDDLHINDNLKLYNKKFADFLKNRLFDKIVLCFAEELKKDSKESNKAWRAFQRMCIEGIQEDVMSIKDKQDEMLKDLLILKKLDSKLESIEGIIDRRFKNEPFQKSFQTFTEELIAKLDKEFNEIKKSLYKLDINSDIIIKTTQKTSINVENVMSTTTETDHKVDTVIGSLGKLENKLDKISANNKNSDSEKELSKEDLILPLVRVTKIYYDEYIEDTYSYDLETLMGINRKNFIYIFGNENKYLGDLSIDLNNFESVFIGNFKPDDEMEMRKWFTYPLSNNFDSLYDEIKKNINYSGFKSIGIILNVKELESYELINNIKEFLLRIIEINPEIILSVLLVLPTRNIDILKDIHMYICKKTDTEIYLSNNIQVYENSKTFSNWLNIHNDNKPSNIITFLKNELNNKEIEGNLKDSLNNLLFQISGEINWGNPDTLSDFSPADFIMEFENKFYNFINNRNNWEELFSIMISVCASYSPKYIEQMIYYSAKSKNEYIRYSTLKYAIESNNNKLIDYWVEGSDCNPKNYENIDNYIKEPIIFIFYPILRFYNRHKNHKEFLKKEIIHIIKDKLDGEYLDDYYIADLVIKGNENDFLNAINSRDEMIIMKIMESDTDIFSKVERYLINSDKLGNSFRDKILLSTRMSSKKINFLINYAPHLILTN